MIEAINLSKFYGSTSAVQNLNLQVAGELFVFLGPNGAGKTTTIKMMTGLLRPSAGRVKIGAYDLWREPLAAKRLFGLAPDLPVLYEKLTVWEFLQFIADIYQLDRTTTKKRIQDLLELFDLESQSRQLIQTYSLGMKRKCALAAALIHDPKVLFLDEPTSGLDPKSAHNLKRVLRELVKRGCTVFMSTHILEIAEAMCDRVGIIHHGQLIAQGTMSELRSQAQSHAQNLETIFLELTGGVAEQAVLKYLETE